MDEKEKNELLKRIKNAEKLYNNSKFEESLKIFEDCLKFLNDIKGETELKNNILTYIINIDIKLGKKKDLLERRVYLRVKKIVK
ncbi:MAG: hypothetical protein ACFFDN_10145 [Candidatus Hodarchaeota archaeon]